MKEYDVHFSLNGFFRKIDANSPEEAKTTAESWLTKALSDLEKAARVGLGIEIIEAIDPEDFIIEKKDPEQGMFGQSLCDGY